MNVSSAFVDQARFNMIEQQVRPWDVLDANVLALMQTVRRDGFVAPERASLAYADLELPLVAQGSQDQVMLAPKVQARIVQELSLKPTDKVLEIGTGSAYTSALMANLAAHVTSLEMHPDIAHMARQRLLAAAVSNVDVLQVDACAHNFAACAQGAPWDAIVLNGSVAEVPAALLELLAPHGRLFAITGAWPMMRATLITRASDTTFTTRQPWDTVAPRLQGFASATAFSF